MCHSWIVALKSTSVHKRTRKVVTQAFFLLLWWNCFPARFPVCSFHVTSAFIHTSPKGRFAGTSGRCDSAWLFASVSLEEGDVHVLRGDRSFTLYYRIFNPRSTRTPLVVCHGGPSLPSQYLYPLVELLDARPIVFFDQLGCGKSDEPKDLSCYSISQCVEDLKEVIWQVVAPNHTSFHLYGHSFGGVLAYEYLSFCLSDDRHAQFSQKSTLPTCRSVMLSNTPNDLGRCNRDYDRMYAKNPLLFWQQHVCCVGAPPPLQDAMKHMGTVWTGMDVVAGYRAAPLPHNKENDEMIPLLVISCARDFAFDTSNGDVWVALLSQNSSSDREFVTLENAAHYPFYENKTAYGEILCEFLSHVELQLSKR